jgi:hypothetical protein
MNGIAIEKESSMGLYNRFALPQVIELAMRQKTFAPLSSCCETPGTTAPKNGTGRPLR